MWRQPTFQMFALRVGRERRAAATISSSSSFSSSTRTFSWMVSSSTTPTLSSPLQRIIISIESNKAQELQQWRYISTSTSTSSSTFGQHKQVQFPTVTLTLYQYTICPYCNIAKTLLDYSNTPYIVKEVNPLTKAEIRTKEDGGIVDVEYQKVPILTISTIEPEKHTNNDQEERNQQQQQHQQLNGSEAIVQYILDKNNIDTKVDAGTATATSSTIIDSTSPSAIRWTDFARNDLAPLLYPNLCNTLGNSYRAFGYIHNPRLPFSAFQRFSIQWIGSLAMYLAASKIKKKRKITDEHAALMEALAELNTALEEQKLKQNQPQLPSSTVTLLSGSMLIPHLGDLTIYGVLRGLQGLTVVDTVYEAYPLIQKWYQQLEQVVEKKP